MVSAHSAVKRCAGNYELISNNTGVPSPNPDWWTARLFKQVLENGFFHTSSSAPCCSPDTVFRLLWLPTWRRLTLAYVDAAPATAFAVNLDVLDSTASSAGLTSVPVVPRGEYFLTPGEAGTADTTKMRLNGALLLYGGVGNLSPTTPHLVTVPGGELALQPLTYGFVEFPDVPASGCQLSSFKRMFRRSLLGLCTLAVTEERLRVVRRRRLC